MKTKVEAKTGNDLDDGDLLLINKPERWTSFDVVKKVRLLKGVQKAGHAGTLDPLATGLLIVCTGKKTKQIHAYTGLEKEYIAHMTLGGRTESFDRATPVIDHRSIEGITREQVLQTMNAFLGTRLQVPPMWSAVKVGGKRLYKYARRGKTIDREPREIVVRSIIMETFQPPSVTFRVICSKGTYIRSLVDEIGRQLNCGAYLAGLVRTRIGEYRLEDALSIDEIPHGVERNRLPA